MWVIPKGYLWFLQMVSWNGNTFPIWLGVRTGQTGDASPRNLLVKLTPGSSTWWRASLSSSSRASESDIAGSRVQESGNYK